MNSNVSSQSPNLVVLDKFTDQKIRNTTPSPGSQKSTNASNEEDDAQCQTIEVEMKKNIECQYEQYVDDTSSELDLSSDDSEDLPIFSKDQIILSKSLPQVKIGQTLQDFDDSPLCQKSFEENFENSTCNNIFQTPLFMAPLKILKQQTSQINAHQLGGQLSVQTLNNKSHKHTDNYKILIEAPDNASDSENKIHAFLDGQNAFKICVKEYISNQQRVESTNVKKEWDELRRRQSQVCSGTQSGPQSFGCDRNSSNTPSFLLKRIQLMKSPSPEPVESMLESAQQNPFQNIKMKPSLKLSNTNISSCKEKRRVFQSNDFSLRLNDLKVMTKDEFT